MSESRNVVIVTAIATAVKNLSKFILRLLFTFWRLAINSEIPYISEFLFSSQLAKCGPTNYNSVLNMTASVIYVSKAFLET